MRHTAVFLTLAMMLLLIAGIGYGEHVIDSSKNPQFLYALNAKSGSFEDATLTLKDVPSVIYFSDRPDRIAGHISLKKFVRMWEKGEDNFKANPPNAIFSIFDESGKMDFIVELMKPHIKGDNLSFDVKVLKGKLPPSFGTSSIFIDTGFLDINDKEDGGSNSIKASQPLINKQITD